MAWPKRRRLRSPQATWHHSRAPGRSGGIDIHGGEPYRPFAPVPELAMPEPNDTPRRTALYDRHVAAGAEMIVADGWEMPRSYGDPAAECRQAHARAAVFDVSHVGRIRIRGDGGLDLLEHVCTGDVARQEDDTAVYTLLLNERGGIIDGGLLVRLATFWVLTCSPGRRAVVLEHLRAHAERFGAKVDDQTPKTSMVLAVGPQAPGLLDAVLPATVSALPRGAVRAGSMLVARYIAMRTGQTRLWSLEVMIPHMLIGRAWDFVTAKAGANAIAPAGQAAREVLRIEAGLPRYGREIDESVDPVTAGLEAAVDFERDFLGAEAVRAVRERGPERRRVGLIVAPDGPGPDDPPPPGAAVRGANGAAIGSVTSAACGAAGGATVAMAYVARSAAEPGSEVRVEAGGAETPARVVALPFRPDAP